MVSLPDIQSSNARIAKDLPEGLVAVFMGATSGIGETSMKQFAKHARKPRVYLAARSEESANRVIAECKALNAEGEYIFIRAEISLIRAVDEVCRVIAEKEVAVNLLFMTAGGIPSRICMY
jgi:NADP-dependent 3-hydroxy acid dehydrogenase YdfG